jgi:hypothetical protein
MWEYDIDAANDQAVKRGDCPDCGERIDSEECCSAS